MTVDEGKIKTMLDLSRHLWLLEDKREKINCKIMKHNPQELSSMQEHAANSTLCKLKNNNAILWFAVMNPKKFDESFFEQKKQVSAHLLREACQHMNAYEAEANRILEKAHKSKL